MLDKIKTLLTKIEIVAQAANDNNIDYPNSMNEYDAVHELVDIIKENSKPTLKVIK